MIEDVDDSELQSNNLRITLVAYDPGGKVNEILQVHLLCFGEPCMSSITGSVHRTSPGCKTVSRLKSAILIFRRLKSVSGLGGFECILNTIGSSVFDSSAMEGTGILIDWGISFRRFARDSTRDLLAYPRLPGGASG